MDKDNIIELLVPKHDALQEVLREGAQRLLAQAIEAEVEDMLEQHQDRRMPDGRAGVVRNGYLPERELQTGIGPVTVQVPKVRAKSGRAGKVQLESGSALRAESSSVGSGIALVVSQRHLDRRHERRTDRIGW